MLCYRTADYKRMYVINEQHKVKNIQVEIYARLQINILSRLVNFYTNYAKFLDLFIIT